MSGADIKAACTEAGLLALRERRMRVTQVDFRKAKEKVGLAGLVDIRQRACSLLLVAVRGRYLHRACGRH